MLAEILKVGRDVFAPAKDTCDNPIHFNILWHMAESRSHYGGAGLAAAGDVVGHQVEGVVGAAGQVG